MRNRMIGFVLCTLLLFSCCSQLYICAENKTVAYSSAYARTILRAVLYAEEKKEEYDVNGDGRISTLDAKIALRRSVGLPDVAPTTVPSTTQMTTKVEETTVKEYSQIGVLSTCGLTEARLKKGLLGNLPEYAKYYLQAEAEYNVNAVFLAAVSALESGWGKSYLAVNKNNLFGWKGGSSYRYFNSVEECIMHVAKYLRKNYLTPGGSYFNGYSVEAVGVVYCTSSSWASQVNGIMRDIERRASA